MRNSLIAVVAAAMTSAFAGNAALRGEKAPYPAAKWALGEIKLPEASRYPLIACTPAELERLRKALRSRGAERMIAAAVVADADRFAAQEVVFPPRGGQHNQWYQCNKCQLGLHTVDDTHHRCPRCGTVYSGEPYDDVIFSRKHQRNLSRMRVAAWAHALTGKEEYAAYAARVLLGYAERYRKYPYHSASRTLDGWGRRSGGHLFEQTLTEASALVRSIAPAYDLIRQSAALSPAEHAKIIQGLLVPMLENIDRNKAGKSNWQTWHNAAMLLGGALVRDAEWVRKALSAPRNGFTYQMQASVTRDGMWYENSWGYHFYTLSALQEIVEGARRLGIDLWSHPALKKMYTVPLAYAMADGSLPRFGDDVNSRVSSASRFLEHAYHAYRDPAMLPYLSSRATWDSMLLGRHAGHTPPPPVLRSALFPGAGHAILRVEGEAGLTAALTFGPYGGFHGHLDKLSFVFFGHGRELGVDPGRARSQAYRLPIHRNWYKATVGHNTVLVDWTSQKPAAGKLEVFGANDSCAAVVARCDEAYPDVRHTRLLGMLSDYLVVFDELVSTSERSFTWIYHQRGARARCKAATQAPSANEKQLRSLEYVQHVRQGLTDADILIEFPQDALATRLAVAKAPRTEVRIGDGPGASVLDRVPLAMITRRGKTVCFAAVLEPVRSGASPKVKGITWTPSREDYTVKVLRGSEEDTIELNRDGRHLSVTREGRLILEAAE